MAPGKKKKTKPVFGTPINPNGKLMPHLVAKIVEYFDDNGYAIEGLFRVSGKISEIEFLRTKFDLGKDVDLNEYSPHVIAGLLKMYLRELPEPLLPYDYYDMFIAIAGLPDNFSASTKLKSILPHLPLGNRILLKYLMMFLMRVSEKSDINKMTPANIAIVFSPNIIKSRGEDSLTSLSTSDRRNALVELFISCGNDIWTDEPDPDILGTEVVSRWVHNTQPTRLSMAIKFQNEIEMIQNELKKMKSEETLSISPLVVEAQEVIDQDDTRVPKPKTVHSNSLPLIHPFISSPLRSQNGSLSSSTLSGKPPPPVPGRKKLSSSSVTSSISNSARQSSPTPPPRTSLSNSMAINISATLQSLSPPSSPTFSSLASSSPTMCGLPISTSPPGTLSPRFSRAIPPIVSPPTSPGRRKTVTISPPLSPHRYSPPTKDEERGTRDSISPPRLRSTTNPDPRSISNSSKFRAVSPSRNQPAETPPGPFSTLQEAQLKELQEKVRLRAASLSTE